MEKVLKLYKDIDGVRVAFPNSNDQIQTSDFTYSAQRMGGAPTISCTIMWGECLDNMWEGVYCEFNGERYHIAKTPSSSKDNTDARYKHNVQFVSDRIKLDSVLFYNKVEENKNPLNTSTEFSFWGDVASFAKRLNKSLESSKLEYRVKIDGGVTSEEKLFKAENMFVSAALQEINKTYGLMYYFVGTEIHVGEQQSLISGIDLQYGFDKQLLSINKNNKNNKIVTRITGHGSDENIPYYYPNPTEKGTIEVVGEGQYMEGKVKIANQNKFASSVNYNEVVRLHQTEKYVGSTKISAQYYKDGEYHSADPISGQFRPYKYSSEESKDEKILARISYNLYYTLQYSDEGAAEITLLLPYKKKLIGTFSVDKISAKISAVEKYATVPMSELEWTTVSATPSLLEKPNYTKLSILAGDIDSTKRYSLNVIFDMCVETKQGNADLHDLENYELYCFLEERISDRYVWKGEKKQSSNIEDFGLSLSDAEHFENNKPSYLGSGFSLRQVEYIQPSKHLMPPVYRYTKGNERFYEAQNDVYKYDNGEYIVFVNEFDESNPSEHIENFEDIKPTIKGVKNIKNEAIDCFSAFAYDLNDNDETDEDGKYIHPYFFGKLRALDFNLFDHAIDSGEMTISMTSGHCASCNFVIGVDDQQQKNLVQVDENGNLLRDENGNVICGRKVFVDGEWIGQSATPQDKQNDTTHNEVWVALKKDTNTFGYVYPNKNIKPSESDTFVILHIDLPQTYITNAENKLAAALIEFMRKNNAEEFDYSVKFSRIFWEENPTALASFNENSRVNVLYNSESAQMYVSSFTYKCSSNEALPEISVSLSKELNIGTNTIQSVVNELKDFEGTVSILEQQSRAKAAPAIRKDIDDDAYGAVTFHQKPTFKEGIQSDKAIKVGIGASEGFADGTGTYIDERKIQVRDLEVRGSLKVTDLVASQIHSLDGEYIFTDTMKIDRVIPTGYNEDDIQTCRLYFEKEYKNDFLKFYAGDLLLSVVANIDDSDSAVIVDDAGNAMRSISMDSFMYVTNTSGGMDDVLWADVQILEGAEPSDGAYVARRGNIGVDEAGLKRANSWSISINDGRIVYYINQTETTREGNLQDNNYGLAIGRLPDITPIRNVGAVGEIGIYAKYLLAQHITQVRWVGDTRYVTIDRGDWDSTKAQNQNEKEPYYFYKEEIKEEGVNTITYKTRTKVEHKQCTWLCTGNSEGKEYNTNEPSMKEGSGWLIISGGGTVTDTIIQYATTQNNVQPTDYDSDGMAIGSDEVDWYDTQEECEYNALFPYMWKKTTTKTMSNPRGDTTIELIGVYGETGLNAHIEVDGGNNILVPCDSDGVVKEDFEAKRKVGFFLDDRELEIDSFKHINVEDKHDFEIKYHKGTFTFSVPKGTKVTNGQKLTYRFVAIDNLSDKELEYTRTIDFLFVHNLSEKAITIQTTPLTAYIPVSNGLIAKSGSQDITVSVIKGEALMDGIDYYIFSANVVYYGNATGYIKDTTFVSNILTMQYTEGVALSESDYATIEIELNNGLRSVVTVLQNISGRDAIGEDAYVATVTPQNIVLPVSHDSFKIAWSYNFTLTAEMYKGNNPKPLNGTNVSVTLKPDSVKNITYEGNRIFVDFEFGVEFPKQPISIGANVTNGEILRKVEFTVTPIEGGKSGEDAYFASLTPQTLIVPVTNGERKILGSPTFYLTAEMYKGSNESALEGTTVSASYTHEAIASIKCDGNEIRVIMESGAQLSKSIVVEAAIKNGHVTQKLSFTLTPIEQGDKGDSGYAGPVQRVFSDKLVSGQEYRNDSDKDKAIGDRYQDMITVYCPTVASGYLAFVCISTFVYSGETTDLSTLSATKIKEFMGQVFGTEVRFTEVAINASSAFFTQMFARNANIRMLSGATITMLNDDQVVVAGMSNAETENGQLGYHFWSGGESGDSANFSVDKNGILRSKGGEFDGYLVTSCEQLDKTDQTLSLSVGAHVFVDRGYTYTLPTLNDDKNGVHFVLVEKVGGNFVAQPYNYVALVGENNTHSFRGAETLKKDTAYTYPTTLRFRSGILDLVWYNGSWWVYNKNVEWFETDLTEQIKKQEKIGASQVVCVGTISTTLSWIQDTYMNKDFEVKTEAIGTNGSYDFYIQASLTANKLYNWGFFSINVTPSTKNDSQKNAIAYVTRHSFGDGYSDSAIFCKWRIRLDETGGVPLPLDIKIEYTPIAL